MLATASTCSSPSSSSSKFLGLTGACVEVSHDQRRRNWRSWAACWACPRSLNATWGRSRHPTATTTASPGKAQAGRPYGSVTPTIVSSTDFMPRIVPARYTIVNPNCKRSTERSRRARRLSVSCVQRADATLTAATTTRPGRPGRQTPSLRPRTARTGSPAGELVAGAGRARIIVAVMSRRPLAWHCRHTSTATSSAHSVDRTPISVQRCLEIVLQSRAAQPKTCSDVQ